MASSNDERVNLCSPQTDEEIFVNIAAPDLSELTVQPNELSRPSVPPPPPYSTIPGTVPLHQGRDSGPPPSYDEVINPEAPPPSYQSLFGQVREARKNSTGLLDFIQKVIILLLGTLGCTVIIGITVVIPFTMVVIGTMYIHRCPVEPYIPIYLVVGGVFGVVKNLLNFWSRCGKAAEEPGGQTSHKHRDSIINCFLFAWFIAGCVWIYRIYEPSYTPGTANYCARTLYLFSFWLITSSFIVFGVFMGCLCCLTASSIFLSPE